MRDDDLSLLQELVRDSYAFIQQPARVLAKIENQSLDVSQLLQRVRNFLLGGFVEAADVDVSDAGANLEMKIHAVTRDFITHNIEIDGLVAAFPQNGDADRCTL